MLTIAGKVSMGNNPFSIRSGCEIRSPRNVKGMRLTDWGFLYTKYEIWDLELANSGTLVDCAGILIASYALISVKRRSNHIFAECIHFH